MRKLEKLVHDAVDESDREILNQTAELGYFSLSLSQFRGKPNVKAQDISL